MEDKYWFFIIGGVLIIFGLILIVLNKGTAGQNEIKFLGFEFKLFGTGLTLIGFGVIMFLLPLKFAIDPVPTPLPVDTVTTFTFDSENGAFNNKINTKLMEDGYKSYPTISKDKLDYNIRIQPANKKLNKKAVDAFTLEYYFLETNILLIINDQEPYTLKIKVPGTGHLNSDDDAKSRFDENYEKTLDANFELIYNTITKHAPIQKTDTD